MRYVCNWMSNIPHARSKYSTDTPLPTPTHRYNAWADDRKSLGITPRPQGEEGEGGKEAIKFASEEDKAEWEEEQKVVCVAAF